MKAAFHFKVSPTKSIYGPELIRRVFSDLLKLRGHLVNSKVSVGDLLIWDTLKEDNHAMVLNLLLQFEQQTWKRISAEKMHHLVNDIVYVICFESIARDTAEALRISLEKHRDYIGAYEINDADPYHWVWYGEKIGPHYRAVNKALYQFYANVDMMPDDSLIDLFRHL